MNKTANLILMTAMTLIGGVVGSAGTALADTVDLLGQWEIRETQTLPSATVEIMEVNSGYASQIYDPNGRLEPVPSGEDYAECDSGDEPGLLCSSLIDPQFAYTVEETGNPELAIMKFVWGNPPHQVPEVFTYLLHRPIPDKN